MGNREFDVKKELTRIVERFVLNSYIKDGELYCNGKKFESYCLGGNLDSYGKLVILRTFEEIYEIIEELPKFVLVNEAISYLDNVIEVYVPLSFKDLREWSCNVENIRYVEEAMKNNTICRYYDLLHCAFGIETEEIKEDVLKYIKDLLEFEQYRDMIIEC